MKPERLAEIREQVERLLVERHPYTDTSDDRMNEDDYSIYAGALEQVLGIIDGVEK